MSKARSSRPRTSGCGRASGCSTSTHPPRRTCAHVLVQLREDVPECPFDLVADDFERVRAVRGASPSHGPVEEGCSRAGRGREAAREEGRGRGAASSARGRGRAARVARAAAARARREARRPTRSRACAAERVAPARHVSRRTSASRGAARSRARARTSGAIGGRGGGESASASPARGHVQQGRPRRLPRRLRQRAAADDGMLSTWCRCGAGRGVSACAAAALLLSSLQEKGQGMPAEERAMIARLQPHESRCVCACSPVRPARRPRRPRSRGTPFCGGIAAASAARAPPEQRVQRLLPDVRVQDRPVRATRSARAAPSCGRARRARARDLFQLADAALRARRRVAARCGRWA